MKTFALIPFALAGVAIGSPVQSQAPIDPNNPLTNPATNRDLYLTNPMLLSPNGAHHWTPQQVATIQNQLAAQKNLELVAAQMAAQAGVPPPAGISPLSQQPSAEQIQIQAQQQAQVMQQAQAHAEAEAQVKAQALAHQQALEQVAQRSAPTFPNRKHAARGKEMLIMPETH